jgi:hypothetical protein
MGSALFLLNTMIRSSPACSRKKDHFCQVTYVGVPPTFGNHKYKPSFYRLLLMNTKKLYCIAYLYTTFTQKKRDHFG